MRLINKKLFNEIYLHFCMFLTGAAVLTIEIIGTKVLSPFYGNTIFVWTALITTTLGFLALGYFVGGIIADKFPTMAVFYRLMAGSALSSLIATKTAPISLLFSDSYGFQWGPIVASILIFALPMTVFGTLSPLAVKLINNNGTNVGNSAGRIFALSTIGSVTGALLAGFYLIPNFYTHNILLTISTIVAIAASAGIIFNYKKSSDITVIITLLVYAITAKSITPILSSPFAVAHIPSFYGDIIVVQKDNLKCMVVGTQSQSCIRNGSQDAFGYNQAISDLISVIDSPKQKALLVGLGGGKMAEKLTQSYDIVDAIEIDYKIVDVAENHFGFNKNNSKLSLHIQDGKKFIADKVNRNNRLMSYNVIIIDAFSSLSPSSYLLTNETFMDIKKILSDRGLVIINTIGYAYGENSLIQRTIYKTMAEVFSNVYAISDDITDRNNPFLINVLLIGADKPIDALEKIDKTESTNLKSAEAPKFLTSQIINYTPEELEEVVILTDARNSLDFTGKSVFEEQRNNHINFLGFNRQR